MKITDAAKRESLTVYLPDTRGVEISRFGKGNLKIGLGVHTYSKLPGKGKALGTVPTSTFQGTCPGASEECLAICYAARPVSEYGPVFDMWARNTGYALAPTELPPGCRLLRLHVGGDFDTERYIDSWTALLAGHPDVKVWAYTRSWRVPALLPALERLRALPNVQLFASMDASIVELPPAGWRRAWINGDERLSFVFPLHQGTRNQIVHSDETYSFVCPEETGHKPNCESCRYCFDGHKGDVTFIKH